MWLFPFVSRSIYHHSLWNQSSLALHQLGVDVGTWDTNQFNPGPTVLPWWTWQTGTLNSFVVHLYKGSNSPSFKLAKSSFCVRIVSSASVFVRGWTRSINSFITKSWSVYYIVKIYIQHIKNTKLYFSRVTACLYNWVLKLSVSSGEQSS